MTTISIITATYNNESTITNTIESVDNQTLKPYEHIIIDGQSKDGTLQKLQLYHHLKIISEPDNGIYDALNKGIKMAQGDIISWLHADDVYYDSFVLEKVTKAFERFNPDILYGNIQYVKQKDIQKVVRDWKSKPYRSTLIKKGWMPPHTSLFVKKWVFEKYGVYDLSYRIASDYEWIVRVFNSENLITYYLPEYIVKMRLGGKSNRLKNMIIKMKEDYRAIRQHKLGGLNVLIAKNFSKVHQLF